MVGNWRQRQIFWFLCLRDNPGQKILETIEFEINNWGQGIQMSITHELIYISTNSLQRQSEFI